MCGCMCKNVCVMATNLNISDRLILKAKRLGKHKTKREAVSKALEEYIQKREQMKVLDAFGRLDFDPGYDYKSQRKRS